MNESEGFFACVLIAVIVITLVCFGVVIKHYCLCFARGNEGTNDIEMQNGPNLVNGNHNIQMQNGPNLMNDDNMI